ncbi:MAG: PKD domain-containing protein [Oscillospiraceae bacterium]|nr:PKD domain-containing protein [Oscillospiraceae bacterium]
MQTVDFARPESRFNILEIQNYSAEGVYFKTNATIIELIDNDCNVNFANGERSGWTLEQDETIEGDLNLARGTLDLNGHKLTIKGNLIHSGGTLLVNGGELEVEGDYRLQAIDGTNYINSTGVLNMTNEADTVRVFGEFVMQSTASHSEMLTAGTLEIGGNLTQNGGANGYNFCTSGSHTVVLNGTEKQSVSIADNRKDYSRINNLKITNTSADGVDIARDVYVIGNLYNTESKITNGSRMILAGTFADNAWSNDICLNENRTLTEDIEIGGGLYLNGGTLNLNGHTLTVNGDMYVSYATLNINKGKVYVDGNFGLSTSSGGTSGGYLTMTNAEDYICVNGDFLVYSSSAYNTLTSGTVEIKGNFTQRSYYHAHNFAPSGEHKVILSGEKIQKVDFANTQSYFNILEITKDVNKGYVFSRTPLWNELIESNADTEAPTAPKNLKFVRSNSSSIVMAWNPSTDNKEVYEYYVYRDGELIGSTKKTEYVDNGLKSHSAYEYYVVACDTSGNLSEWSNILEAETDVDAFAPTQPANLAAKVQSEGVIRLSWTASSDNGTVVKYNVYRDGTLIGSSNGTAFTDSTAFGGYYEYYVEAVDNEGNVSRASASVFIDNLAPTAPVLKLNSVTDEYISLSWESSDNVGVEKYDLYRNGIKVSTLNSAMYIDNNIKIDTNYTYYVKAYDAAGNISDKSNEVVVYTGEDDEAPVIASIEYAGKPLLKNTVVAVSAADNCGISKIYIKYSYDKVNWTDCGMENAFGKANVSVKFGVDTSEMLDGTVYLCAYAEDINGNVSKIEDSPVYSFTVDNTAPNAPDGVICTSENDTIEVQWNAGGNDVSYFRIYRKKDGEDYSLIKDNYRYINYFESDIELGMVYTYKITAVDENGNESDFSDEVTGCISEDKTKPQVFSVSPVNGSKIGENPEISISCYDNFRLKEVTVQGKALNADEWSDLYCKEIDTYAEVISFELDTSEIETGDYQIKVSLTDSALNKSDDYIVTYDYRECTLSAPVLSAEGAGWSVNLEWTMENADEIAGYYVYRRSSSTAKYSVIGSTTKNSVIDHDVTAGQKYYYYIEAVDIRGNKVKGEAVSAVPTSEDNVAPTAYAGEGLFGIVGKSVSFDGTGSYDNHYVASYKWDFGDGATSNEAKPQHTYSEEGTYKVSLTVYDSAGNSDTVETDITIYNKDYQAVRIRVSNSSGIALSGARVYCELAGGKIDANTDSTGCYDFIAKEGSYDVYFYTNGYLPKMETIKVTGEAASVNVVLDVGEVVVGDLTTRPLELKEILALGIDPKAPENRNVCEYTVNLSYDKEHKTLRLVTNANGDIIKVNETFNEKWTVVAKTITNKTNSNNNNNSIALFSIHTDVSWLAEFFNVELTVINNADDDFTLENCTANLTIPSGLSLAKTERGESSYVKMNTIVGGKRQTTSWILRGDRKGEYYLTAEFNCVLTPFMEGISIEFKNEEPLVVYGDDALELKVDYSDFDPYSDYWTAKFTLTNVSDKPIYDVNINYKAYREFDDINISYMFIEYPSELKIYLPWTPLNEPDERNSEEYLPALRDVDIEEIDKKTLKPGECIVGEYSVSNFQHHIDDDF